jgi:hypothetical protein
MSRLYLKDIGRAGERPIAFVLAPFNRRYFDLARTEGDLVSKGVIELRPHPPAPDVATGPPQDTAPSSGWRLAFAALAVTVTLGVAGYGWARVLVPAHSALALAAPFGAGGLILVSILFERLGAPLSGWGPPVISVVTAGGGYLSLLRSRRRNLPDEPGPVAKSPEEVS